MASSTALTLEGKNDTADQARFFLDCIKEDRPVTLPAATLDEGIKTMELAEAILAGPRTEGRGGLTGVKFDYRPPYGPPASAGGDECSVLRPLRLGPYPPLVRVRDAVHR